MKVIIQRVTNAKITIDNSSTKSIKTGFVVLIGITHTDTKSDAEFLAKKCCMMRVFEDENQKLNLSLKDVGGSLMIVSNFTLYADCIKGNRPSFTDAAKPDVANPLYEHFINECKNYGVDVCCGKFGADMQITLTNDGPVTLVIESNKSQN